MELKTLKDIDILNADLEEYNRIGPTPFFHKKIREEAIRWIKNIHKVEISGGIFSWELRDGLRELKMEEIAILTSWIRYFFNIKESDLKCM